MRSDRPIDDECLNSAPSENHFQLWLENVENIVELFEGDDLSFNSYTVSDGENPSTGESSGDDVDFEEITFDTSDDSSSDESSGDENDAYHDSPPSYGFPSIIELPDSDDTSSPDESSKLDEPNYIEPLTEEIINLEELPVESSLDYGNASPNPLCDNAELYSDLYDSSGRPFHRISPSNPPCSPESCVSSNENSLLPADSYILNSNDNLNSYNGSVSPTVIAKDNGGFSDIPALSDANSAIKVKISREFAIPNSLTDGSYCVESASESETIGFSNNMHMDNTTFDTDSYETSLNIESNACNELVSDKLGSNLKRKVGGPVEDDILNKVPKFIASQETSDSNNHHSSLENYSGVSSSTCEKQSPSEADRPDSKSPTVSDDNVIVTLDKSVEVTFVIEKPKRC